MYNITFFLFINVLKCRHSVVYGVCVSVFAFTVKLCFLFLENFYILFSSFVYSDDKFSQCIFRFFFFVGNILSPSARSAGYRRMCVSVYVRNIKTFIFTQCFIYYNIYAIFIIKLLIIKYALWPYYIYLPLTANKLAIILDSNHEVPINTILLKFLYYSISINCYLLSRVCDYTLFFLVNIAKYGLKFICYIYLLCYIILCSMRLSRYYIKVI